MGNHTLRFTSSFPAVTSSTINLTAGDPTSIVAQAGNNQNATVGTAVAVDPRVLIRDVSNNPVPEHCGDLRGTIWRGQCHRT